MATAFPAFGVTGWDVPLVAAVKARTPINVAEDYGTSSSQVLAAVAAAKAANRGLLFTNTTFNITGDLTVDWDDAMLTGPDGTEAVLSFTGGGLVIDGTAAGYRSRTTLSNLTITRAGAAGPALYVKGAGAGTGSTRTSISNVRVEASTGDGLQLTSSYNVDFFGCYFRNCAQGINIGIDTATSTTSGFAIRFYGGEIQQNTKAGIITSGTVVDFHGTAIEGNTQGLEIAGLTRLVNFFGCYFEANGAAAGDYDLLVGSGASQCNGPVMTGCWLSDASVGKSQSIILKRAKGVRITENYFHNYGTNNPVLVSESAAGSTSGIAMNNDGNGAAANNVTLGTSTTFNLPRLSKVIEVNQVIDYTSIAAQSSQNQTVTVTGAATSDRVHVNTNGDIGTGLAIASAWAGTDTVTIRLANYTAGAIDPAAATYLITVFKK